MTNHIARGKICIEQIGSNTLAYEVAFIAIPCIIVLENFFAKIIIGRIQAIISDKLF